MSDFNKTRIFSSFQKILNFHENLSSGSHVVPCTQTDMTKLIVTEQTRKIRICSDSQAALKALQAVRTSPLVQQCQNTLNDVSTQHAVGLYWVPGHAGIRGNEIVNELAKGVSVLGFLGTQPALGFSRQDI